MCRQFRLIYVHDNIAITENAEVEYILHVNRHITRYLPAVGMPLTSFTEVIRLSGHALTPALFCRAELYQEGMSCEGRFHRG